MLSAQLSPQIYKKNIKNSTIIKQNIIIFV